MDPIRGVEIAAPCGHYYDKECILDLFASATRDESLFPPRCCRQNIPLASVQPYMTSKALQTFAEKAKEFSTLKRVYCANPTCSRFLGPQREGMATLWSSLLLTCPECQTLTCDRCKNCVERGVMHRCNTDANDQKVLALGDREGWARCPGCGQMIELNLGCFHMTCRCRTEFCYLCKARWKTCACPQWDERRLLVAAEQRADAELNRQRALDGVAAAAARAAAARIAPVAHPDPRVRATVYGAVPAQVRDNRRPVVPRVQPPAMVRQPPLQIQRTFRTPRSLVVPEPIRADSASARQHRSSVVQPSASSRRNHTERERLIQHWMTHLRDNHECQHQHWHRRGGAGVCQNCHQRLPLYLFVSCRYFSIVYSVNKKVMLTFHEQKCNGCEMLACRRCRMNRL